MKYLVMIYSNPVTWAHPVYLYQGDDLDEQERAAMTERGERLFEELRRTGELLSGTALGAPDESRTVRVRDGQEEITDGPYIDAKEHLAGFFVIDCASQARAVEIASRFPDTRYGAVEVRPIMDLG